MCPEEAHDGTGHWYIVREHRLFFPLGWLPWPRFQDSLMWSLTRSHIICDRHGGHGHNTIICIDGD
jgi:hypothetical protein